MSCFETHSKRNTKTRNFTVPQKRPNTYNEYLLMSLEKYSSMVQTSKLPKPDKNGFKHYLPILLHLVEAYSLYICLQDRGIISFSVVKITEKLRCCQLDLGHDWKEQDKTR